MVDGDKPPKNKGQSSDSNEDKIDQYDPLFLHSNDTNGVPVIGFKLEGTKNYKVWKAFLIRLDEVYAPIRNIILTTDPIPDVRGAFSTLSRDESHRSTHSHYVIKTGNGNIAFVARTNNRNNNWTGSNNQPRKFNRPNLVYTYCNMNGHTADRCFELVGYPCNFKKNIGTNRGSASNNVVSGFCSKDPSRDWTPSFVLSRRSPYEMIFKTELNLSHLKVFGCLCFSTILNNNDKFSSSDLEEDSLGEPYDDRRDNKSENSNGLDQLSQGGTENTDTTIRDEVRHPDKVISEKATYNNLESAILDDNISKSKGDDTTYQEFNDHFQSPSPILNPDSQSAIPRRSIRKTSMPAKLGDYEVKTKVKYNIDRQVNYSKLSKGNYNFSTSLNKISEPKTYSKAADIRWIDAMNQEMEALNRNGAWVTSRRYVAKGYNQKEGIDYDETFSLVVKIVIVRCLLTLDVHNSWPIYQLDINNAFLYGELEEDVYMTLLEGFFNKSNKRVCKLVKSLYGLKQAPRKWNEKLVSVLLENDFLQSKNDFSLFTKNKNGIFIALLVYEDDIVITGNNNEEIKKVKEFLSSKFLIKDLGTLRYFLGIEVLESNGNFYLTQRKYCLEVLAEFGMLACRPCGTPIETKESTSKDKKVVVGNLFYFMHALLQSHLKLAFRVLRYLKNAPGKGISFVKSKDLNLSVYVDSD
ncbi:ribonuclease H-like domain-containing protein [Tanacetum coccineum]